MPCILDVAVHDFACLRDGTLSIMDRFRLSRHIRGCNQCRVTLLLLVETVDESDSQAARQIRAVAVLADVDPTEASGWLLAMFTRIEA
jgi:hypothetical protein